MGKSPSEHAQSNALYGIGVLGALFYFLSTSSSFLDGLYGIFQAIFWPAYVVFEVLQRLGM